VQTIQGLDIWGLEVKTCVFPSFCQPTNLTLIWPARFDGDTYDPQYAITPFSGAEPSPPGYEDGKVYHGSCHCGAVTTAVKVGGSLEDGTYKGLIVECNCSFCRQVYNPLSFTH
jgi:hypothetical protein